KWYREHIDNMVSKCTSLLVGAQCPQPEFHLLPGSLELPLAAQTLIRNAPPDKPYDAIICFGAIMKGETGHYDMIVNECSRGFGQVMLSEGVPIIMEVLPVSNVEQLAMRSKDDEFNKGIEAALATAEIIVWRRKILRSKT
ncbi:MAG: 6,7-dimethyl-8-ribityllumazine synthase, partial [Patescibacteria group bacterium]